MTARRPPRVHLCEEIRLEVTDVWEQAHVTYCATVYVCVDAEGESMRSCDDVGNPILVYAHRPGATPMTLLLDLVHWLGRLSVDRFARSEAEEEDGGCGRQ